MSNFVGELVISVCQFKIIFDNAVIYVLFFIFVLILHIARREISQYLGRARAFNLNAALTRAAPIFSLSLIVKRTSSTMGKRRGTRRRSRSRSGRGRLARRHFLSESASEATVCRNGVCRTMRWVNGKPAKHGPVKHGPVHHGPAHQHMGRRYAHCHAPHMHHAPHMPHMHHMHYAAHRLSQSAPRLFGCPSRVPCASSSSRPPRKRKATKKSKKTRPGRRPKDQEDVGGGRGRRVLHRRIRHPEGRR